VREFSSVVGGVVRHDYQKSLETSSWRLDALPELRRRLRDLAQVDSYFGTAVPRELIAKRTECLPSGYLLEVSEIEFVSDTHAFGAYVLSPVACQGTAEKPLPVFMFFHGQTTTINRHMAIPGVDIRLFNQIAASDNVYGDIAYLAAGLGLAHVVIPVSISDSPMRIALNRMLLLRGTSLAALEVRKAEQALDFVLKTRSVDQSKIVSMGISMGAQNALLFTALNERVSALALLGWAADLSPDGIGLSYYSRERLFARDQPEELFWPGLLTVGDSNIFYWLLAPRFLLLSSGTKDHLYSPENVHQSFKKITNFYRAIGANENRISFAISQALHVIDKETAMPWLQCVLTGCPDDRRFFDHSHALRVDPLTTGLLDNVAASAVVTSRQTELVNLPNGDGTLRSLYLNAPNEAAFEVEITPGRAILNFAAGIHELSRALSDDGVELKIVVEKGNESKVILTEIFDDKSAACFKNFSIPLEEFVSQRVKMRFIVGERGNPVSDHFLILSPQLSFQAKDLASCARN
jgi:pimeloyl-ACP methyl ester carboxylesterase